MSVQKRESISALAGAAGPVAAGLRGAGLFHEAAILDGLAAVAREYRDTFPAVVAEEPAPEATGKRRGRPPKPPAAGSQGEGGPGTGGAGGAA